MGIAVLVSVILHVLLAFVALPAMLKTASRMALQPPAYRDAAEREGGREVTAEAEPRELEIELPQFIEMVERRELRESLLGYLRTTQNEATEAPDEAAFQSDRNTRAASELDAVEDAVDPLPTQRGEDIPVIELARREYVDGEIADDRASGAAVPEGTEASAASSPSLPSPPSPLQPLAERVPAGEEAPEPGDDEKVAEAAAPPPGTEDERFAEDPASDLLVAEVRRPLEIIDTPRETRIEERPEEQQRPKRGVAETPRETDDPLAEHRPPPVTRPLLRPGSENADPDIFQPQTRLNEQRGTITNRGAAAANAVDTPMGRYMRQVTSAIEKEWNRKRVAKSDFVTFGNIRLKFFIDSEGKVRDLRIENPDKANPIMQDFTLSAVLEAPIPPIPRNLLSDLTGRRLPITYDIIIY